MPQKLAGVCLVTDDVLRLGRFYESVLQTAGQGDDQYYYIGTDTVQVSFYSTRGMESLAPGSTLDSSTGRWVLEIEVEDVDTECARLAALDVVFVKPPATHPWGLRSVWFRDPDGTIVDFFAKAAS